MTPVLSRQTAVLHRKSFVLHQKTAERDRGWVMERDDGSAAVPVDVALGTRVTLRHRVGDRDGRPLLSDAVGELIGAGPDAVVVHTRRGPVRVARTAVVAVRAIPPPPQARASLAAVARLESLCADAWPAAVDEARGAWRLRAAGGFTGRANSALVLGDPGRPVRDALDEVAAFARRHGIAPRLQVPVGTPWERAVREPGWVPDLGHVAGAEVIVLVGAVGDGAAGAVVDPHGSRTGADVELSARPDPDWWTLLLGRPPTSAERGVLAPRTTGGPDPDRTGGPDLDLVFALVRDADGTPVAQARGAVVADHLHVARLSVAPSARRRGLARTMMAALARWATPRGARATVLQVAVDNTAALALYQHLGYREHHRYRYLAPPPTSLVGE